MSSVSDSIWAITPPKRALLLGCLEAATNTTDEHKFSISIDVITDFERSAGEYKTA